MRTEMREVRIGEWLGPIDWTFDFEAERSTSSDPNRNAKCIKMLHEVEDGLARGERWLVSAYGVSREVINVGMYDGWPYWKPTPTYLTRSWMGGEPMSWHTPSAVFREDRPAARE
jgi:hypothetical protein